MSNAVTVAVRCRPFNARERASGATSVIEMDGVNNVTCIKSAGAGRRDHAFAFDHAFWSFDPDGPDFCSQEQVYDALGVRVLDAAFNGYNSCLFAYGQTGSGKTYTMMGYGDDKGIIPRICSNLFQRCEDAVAENPDCSHRIQVSYMEIYNEKCRCLLRPSAKEVKPREHPSTGPYVEGLASVIVHNLTDIEALMDEGNKVRTVASTAMNATSSRSHAIFTIKFTQIGAGGSEKGSKVNLVDLAGSERADKTGATGSTLKEGANINKSLVCLGKVISALAEATDAKKGSAAHIPFRDSVLTWVLKENLGGNSQTVMLATLSPHISNYDESLSTLRYADRAKRIKTHAVVNEDPTSRKIRELTEEVARLKKLLTEAPPPAATAAPTPQPDPQAAPPTPEEPSATPPPQPAPQAVESTPASAGQAEATGGPSAPASAEPSSSQPTAEGGGEDLGADDGAADAPEAYNTLSAEEQLRVTVQALEEVSKPWASLEQENDALQASRKEDLRKLGLLTVAVDTTLPSLVNLSEDPSLSGCLAFYLRGTTSVGDAMEDDGDDTGEDGMPHHITLQGGGVLPSHCVIETDGVGPEGAEGAEGGEGGGGGGDTHLTLSDPKASVFINGVKVAPGERVKLRHRDRVIFGAELNYIFRFADPREAGSPRSSGRGEVIDYEMAVREKYSREVLDFKEKVLTAMSADDSLENSRKLQEALSEKDDLQRRAMEAEEAVRRLQRDVQELSAAVPANLLDTSYANNVAREGGAAVSGGSAQPVAGAPLPTPRLPAVSGGGALDPTGGRKKHVDPTLFSAHRQASLALPARIVKRVNFCLLGGASTGKSSVRKCLQSDPVLGFFKKLPDVFPTTRVEVQEHRIRFDTNANVTSASALGGGCNPDLNPDPQDLAMSVLDFPGEEVYMNALEAFVPQRSIYCLFWKIGSTDGEMAQNDEERLIACIEAVAARSPNATFVIIATHLDLLPKASLAGLLEPILMKIQSRVTEYLKSVEGNSNARVAGCYAVSCKTRQCHGGPFFAQSGGSAFKFSDLLKALGKLAHTECVNDSLYPNGAIPGRQLRFAKALLHAKEEGGRLFVPIQEFSQLAEECGIADAAELAETTHCLQAWGLVFLFTQSSRLLDNPYVFLYPGWLRRVVCCVASYAHMVKLGPSSRKELSQRVEFGASAALFADGCSVLSDGTFPPALLAVVLHRAVKMMRLMQVPQAQHSTRLNASTSQAVPTASEVEMCKQLLASVDSVFTTTEEDEGEPRCLAPSLFPVEVPAAVSEVVGYLSQKGVRRMLMMNVLPHGFFPRLLCSLSKLFHSLAGGGTQACDATNYLLGDDRRYIPRERPMHTPLRNHWKNAVWLAMGSVRALLSVEDTILYLHAAPCQDGPDDLLSGDESTTECDAAIGSVDNVVQYVIRAVVTLAEEYPGITMSVCRPCLEPGCENWFDVSILEEAAANQGVLECQGCGSQRPAAMLLEDRGLEVAPNPAWDGVRETLTSRVGADAVTGLLSGLSCGSTPEGSVAAQPAEVAERLDEVIKITLEQHVTVMQSCYT